jgi:hypothetical protein
MKYTIKKWGVLTVVPGDKDGLEINLAGFEFEGDLSSGFNPELAMEAVMARLQIEILNQLAKGEVSVNDMEIVE